MFAQTVTKPEPLGLIALAIAIIVMTLLAAWIVKGWMRGMSLPCHACMNTRVNLFRELDNDTQQAILSYFREYEHREPDREGIFVCMECRTVFDDFSGEKMSREVDALQMRTICKVCNTVMISCGMDCENIHCRFCGTKYEWKEHGESGFTFLMPSPGTVLADEVYDIGIA